MHDVAVLCDRLVRVYTSRSLAGRRREVVALQGIDLAVPKGTVFGLLGPNGAGKTTTIRILSTLLTPTSGSARVAGFDVVKQAGKVRERIGLVLGGERGLYGRLTGKENLRYFAALSHLPPAYGRRRADELLELVGLAEAGDRLVEQYSRGMRQRLHVARGLVTDPEVVFMDEPTTGMDPIGAQELRELVPTLAREGKTVLLTTHYMLEADQLCERLAIVNAGGIIAEGTPAEIKRHFSQVTIVEATLRRAAEGTVQALQQDADVRRVVSASEGPFVKLTVHVAPGSDLQDRLPALVGADNLEAMVSRDPTLEEAYVSLLR